MIDSTNSEQALIGSLFIMADQKPITELYRYVIKVDEADFFDPKCATIYRYVKKAVIEERSFDVVSIDDDIEKSRLGLNRPSFSDIGSMVVAQSGFAAIESHIGALKNASLKRSALAALSSAHQSIQTSDNVMQALGGIESAIEGLMMKAHGETSGMVHIKQLMANWVETADEQYQGKEIEKGCTTGFEGADEMLGEELLKPGTLVVVGANPGKGKTQIMIRMAEAIALQYKDRTCQVYSLEMPAYQITDRFMGLATSNKKPKYFGDTDWGLVANHMERLGSTNLFVSDDPVISVEMIKMNARAVIAAGGRISAIFVDYLTLMKMPKADRRDLSVGEVTIQCKRLAKELGCIVVLLAQLSRSNMQRTNKRPINSDLRDSGQIEQDADYIFFPYYDFYFNPDSDCGPYAEIICSKNRHGKAEVTYAKIINGVWYSCSKNEALARLAA